MDIISKDEWVNWKKNPVTRRFLLAVHQKREDLKEGISEGQAGDDLFIAIGRCQGLKDCLDYATKAFEFDEEEKTNERGSSGSPDSGEAGPD